jgi:hypothetical protein
VGGQVWINFKSNVYEWRIDYWIILISHFWHKEIQKPRKSTIKTGYKLDMYKISIILSSILQMSWTQANVQRKYYYLNVKNIERERG